MGFKNMFKRDDILHSFLVGTLCLSLILFATALVTYLIGGTPTYYYCISMWITGAVLLLPTVFGLRPVLKRKSFRGKVLKNKVASYHGKAREVNTEALPDAIGEYTAPEERIGGSVVDRLRAHTVKTMEITDTEYDPNAYAPMPQSPANMHVQTPSYDTTPYEIPAESTPPLTDPEPTPPLTDPIGETLSDSSSKPAELANAQTVLGTESKPESVSPAPSGLLGGLRALTLDAPKNDPENPGN